MARPTTKSELLDLGKANYEKLLAFIDKMSVEEQKADFSPGTLNRNIRDVLFHLHHWHLLVMDWYDVGMTGEKPDIPAKGYTWKTTPALNRWILEKYENHSLEEAKESLQKTHDKMRGIIEKHSNEELFEKKRYKWTGSTSLGAYFISCTSSHYDWALKLIRKGKK